MKTKNTRILAAVLFAFVWGYPIGKGLSDDETQEDSTKPTAHLFPSDVQKERKTIEELRREDNHRTIDIRGWMPLAGKRAGYGARWMSPEPVSTIVKWLVAAVIIVFFFLAFFLIYYYSVILDSLSGITYLEDIDSRFFKVMCIFLFLGVALIGWLLFTKSYSWDSVMAAQKGKFFTPISCIGIPFLLSKK